MICSVCEEYAAVSSNDATKPALCGNCVMLDAAGLKKAEATKKMKAQMDTKNAGAVGGMFVDLQEENEKLRAENEKLREDLRKFMGTTAPKPAQASDAGQAASKPLENKPFGGMPPSHK